MDVLNLFLTKQSSNSIYFHCKYRHKSPSTEDPVDRYVMKTLHHVYLVHGGLRVNVVVLTAVVTHAFRRHNDDRRVSAVKHCLCKATAVAQETSSTTVMLLATDVTLYGTSCVYSKTTPKTCDSTPKLCEFTPNSQRTSTTCGSTPKNMRLYPPKSQFGGRITCFWVYNRILLWVIWLLGNVDLWG